MVKKVVTFLALTLPLSAAASTVSYHGYTLDTDSNIVTGGGLEWLQWDQTAGQSISAALANYSGDGWRLATNTEMAALFNAFNFGSTFDTNENTTQEVSLYDSAYSFGVANEFIALFGDTYAGFNYDYGDPLESSAALFGIDPNQDGYYNFAVVTDEYDLVSGQLQPGRAAMYDDYRLATFSYSYLGVALVQVTQVPLPASGWLFMSGLTGLMIRKRLPSSAR